MALTDCSSELERHLGPKASVVTGSLAEAVAIGLASDWTSHGITQLRDVARGDVPGVGSLVISRCVTSISAGSPQMMRCQTLPSMWTLGKDKTVIPGVPFIR